LPKNMGQRVGLGSKKRVDVVVRSGTYGDRKSWKEDRKDNRGRRKIIRGSVSGGRESQGKGSNRLIEKRGPRGKTLPNLETTKEVWDRKKG